jgi:DNA invertase Pin-like site-specific DNA recombinase
MARTQAQLEQAAAEAEAWLNSLDPATEPADDIRDLRAITAAVDAITEDQAHLTEAVATARRNGRSWSMIARALGVSKQAAQKRYGAHANAG